MEQQTILIIDDDARNIFALKLVLQSKGYSCITATQAEEGIRLLKENNSIAIVLMDMMMPGIDGYQALSLIKNDADIGHIPIVAVTAQAMKGDKEKCLQAGAQAYVSKPINVDELIVVISQYLK